MGKFKEATGSQLINRRNPFQSKMWRNIGAYDLAQDHQNIDYNRAFDARLMLIGMFVKMDGVEALQKDMQEEFIINSVLSWKLCKRTYNKQEIFA